MIIEGSYNPALVLLSFVIAVFAAWTALSLISQFTGISSHFVRNRVAVGSLVLGLGIWSMHFVAMLAFRLPIPVRYDGLLSLWSLVAAVVACLIALSITVRQQGVAGLITGGVLLGAGISSMHYIGMAAMHTSASMHYDAVLVVVSVLIGIGASIGALWLPIAINRGDVSGAPQLKLVGSIIMGSGIAGMHYSAMTATSFRTLDKPMVMSSGFELNPSVIGVWLTVSALLLMSFALWSSRIVAETSLIRASEEKISAITANIVDVIITVDSAGFIEFANASMKKEKIKKKNKGHPHIISPLSIYNVFS